MRGVEVDALEAGDLADHGAGGGDHGVDLGLGGLGAELEEDCD